MLSYSFITVPTMATATRTPTEAPVARAALIPPTPAPTSRDGGKRRLVWLDALRGFAALAVVCQHLVPYLFGHQWSVLRNSFDPGVFGVMLFFLVSGYIVPASLERRGDLRAFWTGRFSRLYPLLIAAVLLNLAILPRAHTALAANLFTHPGLALLGNAGMFGDLLGVGAIIGAGWTLSYEMAFYHLSAALFAAGRHFRSGTVAVGFAAAALLSGLLLPHLALPHTPDATWALVVTATVVLAVGLALVFRGRPAAARAGALLTGALALVLLCCRTRSAGFESMMILATMFSGTLLHRVEHGRTSRRAGAWCAATVLAAGVVAPLLWDHGDALATTWTHNWHAWATAYAAAWAVFAAARLAGDRVRSRALGWLGTVSYSVYLLHKLVIGCLLWIFDATGRPHGPVAWLWLTAFFAALLPLAGLSHRCIELPAQRWRARARNAPH